MMRANYSTTHPLPIARTVQVAPQIHDIAPGDHAFLERLAHPSLSARLALIDTGLDEPVHIGELLEEEIFHQRCAISAPCVRAYSSA
jgi:hypothetical protein